MTTETDKRMIEMALETLRSHGEKALALAREIISQEKIEYQLIYDALRYFSNKILCDFHHPALLLLACEAVGGDPKNVLKIGASVVILSGAVDIHDDIIDRSEAKAAKLTVYGKFGSELALLVGDALLFKGLLLLHEACEKLPKHQGRKILELVRNAFFEIGMAEAEEVSFRGKSDLNPNDYLNIIRRKAALAEICMRIGAILGGGSRKEVNILGHYGRTLGTLMTVRDEFVDIFEPEELKHRVENECLPLPLLYSFQTPEVKGKITEMLKKHPISADDCFTIIEIIMKTKGVKELKRKIRKKVQEETKKLALIRNGAVSKKLATLLLASLEDI